MGEKPEAGAGPDDGPDDVRGHGTAPAAAAASDATRPPAPFPDPDDLTGLLGHREVQGRLALPVPPGLQRAVALVELDGFALVQDAYGTTAAEAVLRTLAARLRATLPEAVQLGRWGGDTFVAVLDEAAAATALEELGGLLVVACREPVTHGALTLRLTASVGLADSETFLGPDLLAPAHLAVRAARAEGGDRLRRFAPNMRREQSPPLLILSDLRRLLGANDFSDFLLHFQPIVDLRTRHVSGVEALVRWQHPTQGLLGPERFIGAAEANGTIEDLGLWVLAESCRAAVSLQAVSHEPLAVSVNLSARQLAQPNLVGLVRAVLDAQACPPGSLVLEVSERSVAVDLVRTAAVLEQLKGLGVRIALDDFGTAYSSLLYLKHFPVDVLKVDRSFVAGLGSSPGDSAIVASTVSMADNLGITCVAEGVETVDQLQLLREMGCGYGQGYVFSRPRPLEALHQWLDKDTQPRAAGRRSSTRAVDESAEVVARVLELHRQGASLHTIAAALNSQGAPNARGARWSAQAVAAIIATSQFPRLRLPE